MTRKRKHEDMKFRKVYQKLYILYNILCKICNFIQENIGFLFVFSLNNLTQATVLIGAERHYLYLWFTTETFFYSYWFKLITWRDSAHRCGVTPHAHSARIRKIPGWKYPDGNFLCKQAGVWKTIKRFIDLHLLGFCLFSLSSFAFSIDGFQLRN